MMRPLVVCLFLLFLRIHRGQSSIDSCNNLNSKSSSLATVAVTNIQTYIITEHNNVREDITLGQFMGTPPKLQPKAKNMRKMTWDDGLANIAMNRADACFSKTFQKHTQLGENWHLVNHDDLTDGWQSALRHWKASANNFDYSITSFDEYTQMIWANSYKIGCASKQYKDGTDKKLILLCIYKVKGNVAGEKPYLKGDPCTACPKAKICDKTISLCG